MWTSRQQQQKREQWQNVLSKTNIQLLSSEWITWKYQVRSHCRENANEMNLQINYTLKMLKINSLKQSKTFSNQSKCSKLVNTLISTTYSNGFQLQISNTFVKLILLQFGYTNSTQFRTVLRLWSNQIIQIDLHLQMHLQDMSTHGTIINTSTCCADRVSRATRW